MTSALFVVVALGLASPVVAEQLTHHVATTKIEFGDWILNPIYTENVDRVPAVVGFLAVANRGQVTGNNIRAVWYIRDPVAGTWSARSWSTNDPWKAISSVKSHWMIPDDQDDRWSASDDGGASGTGGAPELQNYDGGVLADDPFAPILAESPFRDVILETLVAAGHRAASLPIDALDGCDMGFKLDSLAAAVYETLVGNAESAVQRSMTAWVASGAMSCTGLWLGVQTTEGPPRPVTPWSDPSYGCTTEFEWLAPDCWSTCLSWVQTRTVQKTRTRAKMNPSPPPTYLSCDQTNTGIETRTHQCCYIGCITLTTPTVAPCPTVAPGTTPPIGTGCPAGSTPTVTTVYTWSGWVPPCPF